MPLFEIVLLHSDALIVMFKSEKIFLFFLVMIVQRASSTLSKINFLVTQKAMSAHLLGFLLSTLTNFTVPEIIKDYVFYRSIVDAHICRHLC